MTASFDSAPLQAFFDEVLEQLGIQLKYDPDNTTFPIQLENRAEGIPRNKCVELLQFIKGQIDLRDNEIGPLHTSEKKNGKFILEISVNAAKALADVYALSLFYPKEKDE